MAEHNSFVDGILFLAQEQDTPGDGVAECCFTLALIWCRSLCILSPISNMSEQESIDSTLPSFARGYTNEGLLV